MIEFFRELPRSAVVNFALVGGMLLIFVAGWLSSLLMQRKLRRLRIVLAQTLCPACGCPYGEPTASQTDFHDGLVTPAEGESVCTFVSITCPHCGIEAEFDADGELLDFGMIWDKFVKDGRPIPSCTDRKVQQD